MNKYLFLILLQLCLALNILVAEDIIPLNKSTVYIKYDSVWLIENESDLGKEFKDVKNKKVFYFSNKLTVINSKKVSNVVYLQVEVPDGSKYWAKLDYFTTRFITVLENDLPCYTQPDVSYKNKNILQKGYFAYFIKEKSGFINVDFIAYAPKKANEKPVWIGNVWIKSGYTDDLLVARQAYPLARAYNDLYGKTSDTTAALKRINEALSSTEETEITDVLVALQTELSSNTVISAAPIETKPGVYYTPNVNNLRFRESPTLEGKFIRMLSKGEKLKMLEKGKKETINGQEGYWCKFETEKAEIGWCFDAYLSEVK